MTSLKKYSVKALLADSIPVILSSLALPLAEMVDSSLAGRVSTLYLAALSASTAIFSSFTWIFNFLIFGSTATISFEFGRKNWQDLWQKIKMNVIIATVSGLVAYALLYIFKAPLFQLMKLEANVEVFAEEYFVQRIWGVPFALLFTTFTGILRGFGETKTPLIATCLVTVFNGIFSYSSLYYLDWGLGGVALGTSLSFILGFLFLSVVLIGLIKGHLHNVDLWRPLQKKHWKEFGKYSSAIFFRTTFLIAAIFACSVASARIGTLTLAAYQIVTHLWSFASYFIDGYAILATMYAGRIWGERNANHFNLLKLNLTKITFSTSGIFVLIMIFASSSIFSVFSTDPLVHEILNQVAPLIMLGLFIQSYTDLSDGLLFGVQAYQFAAWAMIASVLIIFTPVIGYGLLTQTFSFVLLSRVLLSVGRAITGAYKLSKAGRELH